MLWRSLFLWVALPIGLQAADDAVRIAELEARVKKLEALVEKLLAEKEEVYATSPDGKQRFGALFSVAPSSPPSGISAAEAPPRQSAATPTAAPPPAPIRESRVPQELLPDLGKIGAVARFDLGAHSGPFGIGRGSYVGGGIELPLAKLGSGRLNYEFSAGLTQSSKNGPVVSNVAQVANLAVLATVNPGAASNLNAALTGTGAAPFPVQFDAKWNLQLLQLSPFGLKYMATRWDRQGWRPYLAGGLGIYAVLTNQQSTGGLRLDATLPAELRSALTSLFANQAPFGGSLIGGQIAAAQGLADRRLPAGQGGVEIGAHVGTGLEYRWKRGFSSGVEVRYHRLSNGVGYFTFTTRTGFHF